MQSFFAFLVFVLGYRLGQMDGQTGTIRDVPVKSVAAYFSKFCGSSQQIFYFCSVSFIEYIEDLIIKTVKTLKT